MLFASFAGTAKELQGLANGIGRGELEFGRQDGRGFEFTASLFAFAAGPARGIIRQVGRPTRTGQRLTGFRCRSELETQLLRPTTKAFDGPLAILAFVVFSTLVDILPTVFQSIVVNDG